MFTHRCSRVSACCVFFVSCPQASARMYVGETSRSLETRYKDHTAGRHPRTAVGEHLDNTGHKCSLKEAKILDKDYHVSRRRIKEAIRINEGRPGLNRDTDLDIPAIILQLVSHDPEGSCDTNGHLVPSPDEGTEILLKIRELFQHNLTLCAEWFIRK